VKRIIASLLLAPLAGCLAVTWQHEVEHERVSNRAIKHLQPGASDLGACLDALGAPLYVWEYRGDGLVLAYGWLQTLHWGASASADMGNGLSASFNYDSIDGATQGYVLFFDDAWILTAVKAGNLRDLAAGFQRQRPAPVED
jgi:hypothetical protein